MSMLCSSKITVGESKCACFHRIIVCKTSRRCSKSVTFSLSLSLFPFRSNGPCVFHYINVFWYYKYTHQNNLRKPEHPMARTLRTIVLTSISQRANASAQYAVRLTKNCKDTFSKSDTILNNKSMWAPLELNAQFIKLLEFERQEHGRQKEKRKKKKKKKWRRAAILQNYSHIRCLACLFRDANKH